MHKEDPVTHHTGRPSRVGLLEALRKTVDEAPELLIGRQPRWQVHLVKDGVPTVHEPKAEGLWITAERLQQHELVIAG